MGCLSYILAILTQEGNHPIVNMCWHSIIYTYIDTDRDRDRNRDRETESTQVEMEMETEIVIDI